MLGGTFAPIGSGYDLGARATQIRDALAARSPLTPFDMLEIQLDDRALLLTQWRARLLAVLDADALAESPARSQVEHLLRSWDARASTGSVGYRIVRTFRDQTRGVMWQAILHSLNLESSLAPDAQFEEPLARILDEKPANFLPGGFQSWNRFLLAQVDASIERLQSECGELAACTWGRANTVRIRHPLSAALPFLSRFLDMPELPLPGDDDMPRVQHEAFGASERFAVSPGFEQQGLLAIAGGQSAHPLSPYYRAGFREWAEGTPVPLLPGTSEHRLVLVP